MEIIIQQDPETASQLAADAIVGLVRRKPSAVLGLATGGTPRLLYENLAARFRAKEVDFSAVRTFNLDEYVGLPPDHPASYHHYMRENFFRHVNIPATNTHLPDARAKDIPAACEAYEKSIKAAGGIDLQVLGLGTDGHIGFNEPSSSLGSRTRIKTLTEQTRLNNAEYFSTPADVPHHVLTMGIGTIMEAREILLLAFGDSKAEAVKLMAEGPITTSVPASILQMHPRVKVLLDPQAAAGLARKEYYQWVYAHKPVWQP